jgi:DNA-binding transcriptional MerR regulator
MEATDAKTGPDWSIQDVARLAGTTSRTLRHYDEIGLLKPSRVGSNGYRYYDGDALLQLQRILLLRELGLGLPAIAEVFQQQADPVQALDRHLEWLAQEQERLARQMASVRQTIETVKGGGDMVAEKMFDGFDHTQYKDEVEERWGKDSYAKSDAWWRGMGAAEQREWKSRAEKLGSDWIAAAGSGPLPVPKRRTWRGGTLSG